MVDLEVHVESLGQVRGFHEGRDAAFHRHVAAQVIRRLRGEPRREECEGEGEREREAHGGSLVG